MLVPFVGPSYNLSKRQQSVQRTVNMIPVPQEPGNERTAWVFKDVPGLVLFNEAVFFYTSQPYAYEGQEQLAIGVSEPVSGYLLGIQDETLDIGVTLPVDGFLRNQLQTYTHSRPEELNISVSQPQSGTLVSALNVYTHSRPEEINIAVALPQSGTLEVVLVTYTHSAPEALNIGVSTPQSGNLT